MSDPQIITFGCRLNAYESQVMDSHARAAKADENTVIVNTCAVTAEAERQARQAIRRARREKPEANIIVTGCAAQIDPGKWADMAEVDRVLGNVEKLEPASFLPTDDEPVRVNDIMQVKETATHLVQGFEGRARAFVQVQNGCDHRCTFCIIPFGRGNSRSVAAGPIIAQIQKLVDGGYQEIVLTGVDITSYGPDLPGQPTLGMLVERILFAVPDLARLRLTSLDSCEVDDTLFRLIAEEPRLMPHLHLSLQSGDDMILKRMKRRHTRQQAIDLCQSVRDVRPETAFGADFITGFPTETDAMFENTLALVEECDLVYLHVFPYSERPGTPAARMPQLPKPVRKERAARLRLAGTEAFATYLANQQGQQIRALIETPEKGRTEAYAPVSLLGGGYQPGTVASLRVADTTPTALIAKAA